MTDLESQVRFARHNFDNLQSLIRFADTKAAALMAFVALLAGSAYAIVEHALKDLRFETLTSYEIAINSLFCIAWVIFWTSTLGAALFLLRQVISPRAASRYDKVSADAGLMYWEHILRKRSMSDYSVAVRELGPDLELQNLTDQCYELSGILDQKVKALREAGRRAVWIAGSWLCGTLLALILGSGHAH
jgi:hypothetical protein